MGHWELVGVKGALGAGEGLRAGLLTAHYMEHLYQDTCEMRTPHYSGSLLSGHL